MAEASFSDVMEVILIFLLIYFGFRLAIRWFGPKLLLYIVNKIGKRLEKKYGQPWPPDKKNTHSSNQPDVEINSKGNPKHPRSKKDVGEYIDYEEIE